MSARPARVGLMIPSSNTMMEVDFARDLPPGTALHTARMFMEDTTPAGENQMLDEFALPAARDLGTARPDVVVFGCTSVASNLQCVNTAADWRKPRFAVWIGYDF